MKNRCGFTIIEISLFLAITGLLFLGIMTAVAGAIKRARYDESVQSGLDFMQGQFSRALNVQSVRDEARYVCVPATASSPARVEQVEYLTGDNGKRGTTNCSVIGRVLRTSDDASRIVSYPLYATIDITDDEVREVLLSNDSSDVQKLEAMGLFQGDEEIDNYTLPWQTQFVYPSDIENGRRSSRDFTMLIVRMPYSFNVKTYTHNNADADLSEVNNSSELRLCVNAEGFVNDNSTVGVYIPSTASSVSAVRFLEADKC